VDFTERMLNKRVPDMVVSFLRGPWAQVVAEAQLKFADGSGDASQFQSLADDLIWSVQLKLARRNRARLVQMVPAMLVRMRQGLHLISYPEERIVVFFDELITFHEKAFESAKTIAPGSRVEGVPERVSGSDEATPEVSESPWVAESEAADSGYMEDAQDIELDFTEHVIDESDVADPQSWSAESLNTGSWVDLALGGVWVRAQLTWASPHRTLFMFISSGGMAHSMSRRTMERLRLKGLVRMISDGRVMDNALDAVAQAALRNDAHREAHKAVPDT